MHIYTIRLCHSQSLIIFQTVRSRRKKVVVKEDEEEEKEKEEEEEVASIFFVFVHLFCFS
jgi:hypothetical protein